MEFDFSKLLTESITPLVLVSGIGLVLLVTNARFMHVTDRLRALLKEPKDAEVDCEIKALFKRVRLLRGSLASLSGSIVSTSLLVLCVIANQLSSGVHYAGVVFLVLSASLIAIAATLFLLDVSCSISALQLAMKHHDQKQDDNDVA